MGKFGRSPGLDAARKKTVLNIAAGEKRYDDEGIWNVDLIEGEGIDQVVDLNNHPWPWDDNSIDGIHASHILEHFLDHETFLRECHRILKPGGFLRIVVPHCTNMSSVGCLGHYRTFSADTLHRYLCSQGRHDCYMFRDIKFELVEQRVNWVWEEVIKQNSVPNLDDKLRVLIRPLNWIISKMINAGPRWFERFWYPLVGGAAEVVFLGKKL